MHLSKQNEVDLIDLAPLVLFPIAAGVVLEVWTLQLNVFGGWSPSDVLFTAAGVDWTWGFLIAMASVVAIVGTNEIDGSEYDTWEYAVVAFSFMIVPLYEFVPAFKNVATTHDSIVFGLFVLTAFAAAYVAYTE